MADISYTPTTWADGSGGGTPIDATKLNNIETGISDAVAAIGPNDTTEDGTLKAQIDALGESVSQLLKIKVASLGGLTIAGNSSTFLNPRTAINAACPSGYSPIGIVGVKLNNSDFTVSQFSIDDNIYAFQVKNTSGSQKTCSNVDLDVLYVKSL